MKKSLLLIGACLLFSKFATSQDDKKVRFGIRATPAINWMVPDNDKKVQKGGSVVKAGIGMLLEFRLSSVASFQTGLEYTGAGFKAKYQGSDTALYFMDDDKIISVNTKNGLITDSLSKTTVAYHLLNRKCGIGYLNIPFTLKLKTKEMSGMTYFGQIGANLFVKMGSKSIDNVKKVLNNTTGNANGTEETTPKINTSSQINLFNGCASIGGGAEYNISGSTSLYASIHYQHGFMNATKAGTDYLIRRKEETDPTNSSNKIFKYDQYPGALKLRQVVLAIGILF